MKIDNFIRIFVFAALPALALPVSAQRKSDIGFMVAVPWYQGDLSTWIPRATPNPPAIGPFYRYNFNDRNSLRAHAMLYSLGYAGEVFDGQQAEFQASFVDLGLDFEFNWWPYKTAWRRTKYTPYVTAGLGYSINYDGGSDSHLYLPFGGGLKANLGKRMSGGVEVSLGKLRLRSDTLTASLGAGAGGEVKELVARGKVKVTLGKSSGEAGQARALGADEALALALTADVRYAAEDAVFGLPPARLGIGYGAGAMGGARNGAGHVGKLGHEGLGLGREHEHQSGG